MHVISIWMDQLVKKQKSIFHQFQVAEKYVLIKSSYICVVKKHSVEKLPYLFL